jgi:hypothetical protein
VRVPGRNIRRAVEAIATDGPVFLKAQKAYIGHMGIVADTWRSFSEPFLRISEDPNHGWYTEAFNFIPDRAPAGRSGSRGLRSTDKRPLHSGVLVATSRCAPPARRGAFGDERRIVASDERRARGRNTHPVPRAVRSSKRGVG